MKPGENLPLRRSSRIISRARIPRPAIAARPRGFHDHDRAFRNFDRGRLGRKHPAPPFFIQEVDTAASARLAAKEAVGRMHHPLALAAEGQGMTEPAVDPAQAHPCPARCRRRRNLG